MTKRIVLIVCFAALATAATPARANPGDVQARAILAKALARGAGRPVLARQLSRVRALLRRYPKSASGHYTHGRILSALGKDRQALVAYNRAVRLRPRFASAQYNAGVVLTRMKQPRRALVQFVAAGRSNPKLGDAFYNAAQVYYNLGDYRHALRQWQRVLRLEPGSFGVTKKILQAQNALGRFGSAARTHRALWRIQRTSRNPRVRRLKSVVVDQFHMRGYHVFVFETFAPTGNLRYLYRFSLMKSGRLIARVNLESSAVLRERGLHSIIGVSTKSGHRTTRIIYRKAPPYPRLRQDVKRVISKM